MPACIRYLLVSCGLLVFAASAVALVDIYEFDSTSQRHRYQALSQELRCPKCQNQNLAGSDSQIAGDLRRELYRLLTEGKTDAEIKTFMVDRYGEFVLYKPRLQKATIVLWILPIILLIIGIFVLGFLVNRHKAKAVAGTNSKTDKMSAEGLLESLSPQEQSVLDHLLAPTASTPSNEFTGSAAKSSAKDESS
ncbi:MAG: cytochrome c-type biogenesis protein CcmH [Kiritimatiellia bacterium]|jgi:cytochrome c-type biogenesis protein CcmH